MSSSGVRYHVNVLSEFVSGDFRRAWFGYPDCGCNHLDLFLIGMSLVS